MTPKELEKIVLDKIYEGQTYQEIYDELNAKYPNREIDLARMVAAHVSLPQRAKYNVHNIILIILLIVNIATGVLIAFLVSIHVSIFAVVLSLIFPAIYVVLLVAAVRWDLRAYRAAGGLGVLGLFHIGMTTIGTSTTTSVGFNLMNPFNLIPMGMIILGFYLHYTLGGKYKTASQQFTDAKGQIRARHLIQFKN